MDRLRVILFSIFYIIEWQDMEVNFNVILFLAVKQMLKKEPKIGASDLTFSPNSTRDSISSIESYPSSPDGKNIANYKS